MSFLPILRLHHKMSCHLWTLLEQWERFDRKMTHLQRRLIGMRTWVTEEQALDIAMRECLLRGIHWRTPAFVNSQVEIYEIHSGERGNVMWIDIRASDGAVLRIASPQGGYQRPRERRRLRRDWCL